MVVGIQRPLESVFAVEEERAVVDKRVYHEQDGGTEARPQERVWWWWWWWCWVCGMCVDECRSEAGQREVTVPRRSPPRIVPGMSDVECLSVGRRRSRFDGREQAVDFPCSRSCSRGPGE